MDLKELYQEIILDHAKNPRNKGKCEGYNHDAKAHNPLCGDKVHIYLKLDNDKNISGLSFEGEGCAISLASASILTDTLKGKNLNFSKKVTDDFLNMLKNKSKITLNSLSEDQITTISSLSGVQEFPMRIKCATMAWHTLLSAFEKKVKMIDLKEKIVEEIKKIYDPEIPVNIYELGLIYKIEVESESKALIEMTLTSPNCPVAESLPKLVKENILKIDGIKNVDLKLVWDPPWTKDKMSEAAKLELNL